MMRLFLIVFLIALGGSSAKDCSKLRKNSNSKLFCYYSKLTDIDGCFCTHVILPANADVKSVDRIRQHIGDPKILVTVNEFNQGLIKLLKNSKIDGLEINLKKLDSKNDISDFISTVRSKLGSDLYLAVSVPAKSEILAKYYDFKGLSKHADVFILQTAFLGASSNVTFHPSRLSGIWDMQNTDSIVDLVNGLGAPMSKVVISAPVQAFDFTLQNEEYSAVGSPAVELKSITRDDLCNQMSKKMNWTLERDQDQAAPYIFSGKKWVAFEDTSSIDVKAKYSRVRGLAGLALKDVSHDGGLDCGVALLEAAYNGLSRQARAPRQAILHSLEREILETPNTVLGGIHVSPFRISRVIDVEGKWHVIRQDTRTEFTCTRQGYFVHPRSCNRFYRCVKFDQLVDDYSVFEFDCPAGLAFDERVEVCVWPGSLPEGQPCAGSSEIAPVPKERFNCPHEPGYYADPENCRWFFACLDHGRSALTAYEFRCPFGLVFDSDRLMCEWSWLVPKCGAGIGVNLASEYYYGGYSGSGNYQAANVLQTYDGLGALGVVKLDGVRGEIQQPIINSNVGIYGLQGIGGVGQHATQSLYSAGLLRANVGVPYDTVGARNVNLIDASGYNNARVNTYAATNVGHANTLGEGILENRYQSGINTLGAEQISNANAANANSAYSYSVQTGSGNLNTQSNYGAQDLNIVGANIAGYHQTNQYALENNNEEQSQNLYQDGGLDSVVIDKQISNGFGSSSGILYNSNQNVQNVGVSGNVDIVGGGYSAVGNVDTGVKISNVHVAQQPAYSVVPTVTSVPVPSLVESQGFEAHQGGVIANVPELQLKIQNAAPSVSSVVHSGSYITGSTPATIIEEQKPLVAVKDISQTTNAGANSFIYHSQDYSKTGGYVYSKPSIAFEEGNAQLRNQNDNIHLTVSTIRPDIIVEPKVHQVVDIQQNNEYAYSQQHAAIPKVTVSIPSSPVTIQPLVSQGYSYSTTPKPVSFIQQQIQPVAPVTQVHPAVVKPVINYNVQTPVVRAQPQVFVEQSHVSVSSTSAPLIESVSNGYQYPQPAVKLIEEPVRPVHTKIISSYSIRQPENTFINTPLEFNQKQIRVEQPLYVKHTPVAYSTVRPINVVHNTAAVDYQEIPKVNIAPAVVTQYFHQTPSVTKYTYKDIAQNIRPVQPTVVPIISSTPQPVVVNSYSVNRQQDVAFTGYSYPKPQTVFVEEPKSVVQQAVQEVPFVKKTAYVTGHNNNNYNEQVNYNYVNNVVSSTPVTPIVVESYQAPTYIHKPVIQEPIRQVPLVKETVYATGQYHNNFNEQQNYNYVNNIVSSTPATPVVPVVVENYQAPVVYKQNYAISSTPKPTYFSTVSSIVTKTAAPQEFYFYDSRLTTPQPIIKETYSYSKPTAVIEERPIIPAITVSSTPKPFVGYSYPKLVRVFEEKPIIPATYVSSTESYVPVQTVTTSKPIARYSFSSLDSQYIQKPIVVSTPAPFISSYSSTIRTKPAKLAVVENYQAPILLDNGQRDVIQEVNSYPTVIQSTPRPTFISTIASVRSKTVTPVPEAPFYYYDSRLTSPQNEYLPAKFVSTTLRPTEAYSVSTLEDYSTTPVYRTTYTPVRTRIRVTSKPDAVYVRQRSRIRYTSTTEPSISTYPSNEYLPVEKLSTISLPVEVTTPSRDYLPVRSRVTTTGIPIEDEVEIRTRRPTKIVAVNAGRTIIKQNDFLPMLSAKLGAQCTCTSNKLNVRKKQRIIVVEDEDDDDGYVVDNNDGYVVDNNDNNGIVVENYQYEPQKVVDITPTPQVYVKSSTIEPVLTSTYRIRSRQRVRPYIEEEVQAYEGQDETPSDREIVKAVKTGLKLVKQAAKEGAREGAEEAIQNNNLRVRDKIECQRAGLFRHPTQCNKFYSCKWDCTKNKYVVHSFNCPIQLTFDSSLGACNWPSQGPACAENTLLTIQ